MGWAEEDYKRFLAHKHYVTLDVIVTDEEVSQLYFDNLEAFPESVTARHILVETLEEAREISARLRAREDFAVLAQEKSIDPGSKDVGGIYSGITRGLMVEEFEDAIFSLQCGNGVHWVQWQLNQQGADLVVDGSFGPVTEAAVREFQQKNGLVADGIVRGQTKELLNIDSTCPFPDPKQDLRKGARSVRSIPVKTVHGYHIIEVLERYPAKSQAAFEIYRADIQDYMTNQEKEMKYGNFIQGLRENADVKYAQKYESLDPSNSVPDHIDWEDMFE
jgi:parvulin-like peptidyl-prolyl isomerase